MVKQGGHWNVPKETTEEVQPICFHASESSNQKMKNEYKLIQRNKTWYVETIKTKKRKSLRTESEEEARKIVSSMNTAESEAAVNLALAKVYLQKVDPQYSQRTWQNVFDSFSNQGESESTRERKRRAFREGGRFEALREKLLIETSVEDFNQITGNREPSTTNYLKQVQQFALDWKWLPKPVIAPRRIKAPKRKKEPRGISVEECQQILSAEKNTERRLYYHMLYLTGAAQTDGANLTVFNFDLDKKILYYNRKKTGRQCALRIGEEMIDLLEELPKEGYLFPSIQALSHVERASEFRRRTRLLGLKGITLHSFRYGFAERAADAGISERFATGALGHSVAVHRMYSRNAVPVCPVLPTTVGAFNVENSEQERDVA